MPGRPKQGIDYAGWSVDIFDGDKKIDKLLDAKGWKGFGIYFFLCQRAYKTNGYYYEWGYDDCATTARKMGGGINSGTVKETVDYCFQVDLFDQRLFDRWGILTSRGIQRRFWAVLSERRNKTVYAEYWLLKEEECKGLLKVGLNSDLQPSNDHLQPANDETPYIKKSKVNKSIYISAQPSDSFQNQELEAAFQLYLSGRIAKYGELSSEQIKVLREELAGMGSDDRERTAIAKQAFMNGWKGLYPVKKSGKKDGGKKQPSNRFNNFHQREYDYSQLEKDLQKKQMKEMEGHQNEAGS